MGLLREIGLLGSETITIWMRTFTRMTFWCAIGLTGQLLGMFVGAWLGPTNQLLSLVTFIVGELILIIGFVMMLYSAHSQLQSPKQLRHGTHPEIPQTVFHIGRPADALLSAVAPFLVVYATWGFVEDELQTLFSTNIVIHGLNTTDWSVGFDRWRFYLGVAIVVFVAKQLLEQLGRRYFPQSRLALAGIMLCEAGWIFAAFIALDTARANIGTWFMTRQFWVDAQDAWYDLLGSLPDVQVPLVGSLPKAIQDTSQWITQSLIPGTWDYVVLPMFWLALTALVHGWRDFSVRAVLQGRKVDRLETAEHGVLGVITKDAREKYLPVLSCVRLILRAGPCFVAAYLMLAAVLNLVLEWAPSAVMRFADPNDLGWHFALNYPLGALAQLLVQPLVFALYLAAFDRAIADTTGAGWHARRVRRATQTSNVTAKRALGAPQPDPRQPTDQPQ